MSSGGRASGVTAPESAGRVRSRPLVTRLVFLGTLVTLLVVAASFTLLSLEIRRQSRGHVMELLAQNQETVLGLQKRGETELLWISRLMAESPTLRAAMETYQSEAEERTARRSDLVATVQTELDRTRSLLGRDLAVITDAAGGILAVSPPGALPAAEAARIGSRPWVRQVLRPGFPAETSSSAVLAAGSARYRVGCVPITLQDFVIGTLSLGERLDAGFLENLHRSLQSDALIVDSGRVVESTLASVPIGSPAPAFPAPPAGGEGSPTLFRSGGEEYVAAFLPLESDAEGRSSALVLLQSLTRATGSAGRSLFLAVLACGGLASLAAGLAAWRISRRVLRPLERFVAFMRSVAEGGDQHRRFQDPEGSSEIRTLNQTYNLLMDSLQERERQLLQHAREEMVRVDRLKESEKLASLGRMLAGAAHEINNPLTGVVGNVDILLRAHALEGPARERLEKVQKETRRIVGLVRNLLQVARRDPGLRTRVDLRQLLGDTVELRRHDFAAAGLRLRLDFAPGELPAEGSALELQQVFLNLLNNAYDALREGGGEPGLTIRGERQGDQAVVIFEDGGPGMKDPAKVFDHFYTTKEVGKGTGLGLSISHAIVQAHGGSIRAENREEGGARFVVSLPAQAPESVSPGKAEAPPCAGGHAGDLPLPCHVLVVEDEPSILELQAVMLESLGASAACARNGEEAIRLLQREEFDLIVSDLRMPGRISGQDLFGWLAENYPPLVSRILFVTGDTSRDSTQEFLRKTGRPCLSKPFSVEEYVTALRDTLAALRSAA